MACRWSAVIPMCAPIAGSGRHMQRDDWYTSQRSAAELADPEAVGRYAAERLANSPKLTARIDPFTDIMMLQLTGSGGFQTEEARLAAHHAINKEALSKAFFAGKAVPISVLAPT